MVAWSSVDYNRFLSWFVNFLMGMYCFSYNSGVHRGVLVFLLGLMGIESE